AMYQTSQHGLSVAGGDERAAVCTDCHGVHDIRAPDHPRSPANPANLGATCGRCHGDRSLMERYGHDHELVERYESSVHGRAVAAGNVAAPTCVNCHGVHGATPPGVGDVGKVCGTCHVQARVAFLAGPHGTGLAAANLPECESCHSNHAIHPLDDADLGSLCAECHEGDSEAVQVGLKVRALIGAASEELDRAELLTLEAEKVPLDVEDHLARLGEARTYVTEAQTIVHAVSVEPVEEVTRRARSIGQEIQHELYSELDRTNAHIGLAIFWFYVLMTLVILFGYRRRLGRASGRR
ncbi:MAG: cytochrome c3 family protein, partial [Acidobacteriota bacterium]|nr:cytochrome c3 family protein [Acidobacteriota bacterium]